MPDMPAASWQKWMIIMKQQRYAVVVLFALLFASGFISIGSYHTTSRKVSEDMDRALALTMQEQRSNVISQDTIRAFNSHLKIARLRGRATLAVDTRARQFKAYAHCSKATIFSLSDQRPAALLWMMTACWMVFVLYRRRQEKPLALATACCASGKEYGGLTYSETEKCFFAADGEQVRLTPMQHQLMEMFFHSPSHLLSKAEICEALWPKKPDASETLYTLVRRLKPIVEQHSQLRIESCRGKSYSLIIKEKEN